MKIILLLFAFSIHLNLQAQVDADNSYKGQFRLKLGLPYLNNLKLQPNETISTNKFGFLGESVGLEFSYCDNRFLEMNFSFIGVADNPLPFPVDREGEYNTQYSSYLSLTHNHQKSRITYGYGLNYSINTYAEGFRSFEDSVLDWRNQITNRVIGLTINSYYRIGKSFNIGLIYRPTFLSLSNPIKYKYEHLISLEAAWRIILKKSS